jgi:hypothetical protein
VTGDQGNLFGKLRPDPYGGRAPHNQTETSKEASASLQAVLGPMQQKVLRFIGAQGAQGATCDEVELGLEMKHQTASARIRELSLKDKILLIEVAPKPDGTKRYLTRLTRSNRPARVYVVPDHHPDIV